MRFRPVTTSCIVHGLAILIFAGGVTLWLSDLSSDPPLYYSGLGQSLATDPAMYVFHARNEILFGQWDPFNYPFWTVFQHSLTSLAAYLWFSVTEVSLVNANIVGVILSLSGLLFFALGLARHHRPWAVALFVLCYAGNVTLMMYGREPYLENGLIFISGIFFFVFSRWGQTTWGAVLCGILVALAAFTGKLFGALLLPALLLAIITVGGQNRWRRVLITSAAFIVSSAVIVAVLYGQQAASAFAFTSEHTYERGGIPVGLTSPGNFLEYLVSYGHKNRLFFRSPDLLVFFVVGGLMLILFFNKRKNLKQLSPGAILSLFWVGAAFLGLMPHEYSPQRYSLIMIPAVLIAFVTIFDYATAQNRITASPPGKAGLVLLTFVIWFAIFQGIGNTFRYNTPPDIFFTYGTLAAAAALALTLRHVLKKWSIIVSRPWVIGGLILIVGSSVIWNGVKIRKFDHIQQSYNVLEANDDLKNILNPGAVVSGPYGPALTIDNDLKSFIYFFGIYAPDSALFDHQPITHLTVDVSNYGRAVLRFPQLANAVPVTKYWIRDVEVVVLNISPVFQNPQARTYQPSAFENAAAYHLLGNLDSALVALNAHHADHPISKSSGKLLADILWRKGRYEEGARIWAQLAEACPTDFHIQFLAGDVYLALGAVYDDKNLTAIGMQFLDRGVRANPYRTYMANDVVKNRMGKTSDRKDGGAP